MDHIEDYTNKLEEMKQTEPELLVRFVVEMHEKNKTTKGRKHSATEQIAYAIVEITCLYQQVIRESHGGWCCGTYTSSARRDLIRVITARYGEEKSSRFVDFCIACSQGRDSLCNADNETKTMVDEFLAMRPRPIVHPRRRINYGE